jgi:hypothetical protein
MLWNTPVLEATINHIGYNYLDYKIPLLRYYGKREAMKVATKIFLTSTYGTPIRFKGYEGVNLSWNSDLDKAKSKMESYSVKIDTALLAAFKQYLADCRQKNIKLVFVYTPEYKNGQAFVKNREQLISLYKELATQYNIPFYDYSDDALSYQKKYFYNVEHLNRIGSELFTRKFIDTLKKSDLLKSITHK